MRAPDYFGEAAMLGRSERHATAIADSAVEVLVLLKLDFDLKLDGASRQQLKILVSQYPKDSNYVQCAPAPPSGRGCAVAVVAVLRHIATSCMRAGV